VTIVFYTTGHGFGHATRDIAIINALRRLRPQARVLVRTTVPEWLFESALTAPVELQRLETDVGVVQIDSLRLDAHETARRAADFYAGFDHSADAEARVLHRLQATVVVGDVPPLAFAAAAIAGVPSVAVSNFTWDWIYEGFPGFKDQAPGVIERIAGAYRHTTLALRLPFHGGFEPMRGVVQDIPLVARRARHDRAHTRRVLGFPSDRPVVLASFGGFGLALPVAVLAAERRFLTIATDVEIALPAGDLRTSGAGLQQHTFAALTQHGLGYPDLVAACDVVITKPGYGIVSECVANSAALIYAARGGFVEQDVLLREMPRYLRCGQIDADALRSGQWASAIDRVMRRPPPADTLPIDGAAVAARRIVDIAGTEVGRTTTRDAAGD
jgi:UDP:flavonoid glycosyltransferase YjiC (YdhE family)